jgi:hypothetical protein
MNAKEFRAALRRASFVMVRTETGDFVRTTKGFALELLENPTAERITCKTGHLGNEATRYETVFIGGTTDGYQEVNP